MGFIALSVYRWAPILLLVLLVLLLPFLLFERQVVSWTTVLIASGGSRAALAAGLAGLLALDLLLPVPSSLISTAAGGLLGLWAGALTSWAGMTAGALLGYWLGFGSRAPARRLAGTPELKRVSAAGARYGDWIVVLFRAVPVLAEASVIFAGLARVPLRRFLLMAGLANAGISLVYSAIGALSLNTKSFLLAFAGALLVPLAALLAARYIRSAR